MTLLDLPSAKAPCWQFLKIALGETLLVISERCSQGYARSQIRWGTKSLIFIIRLSGAGAKQSQNNPGFHLTYIDEMKKGGIWPWWDVPSSLKPMRLALLLRGTLIVKAFKHRTEGYTWSGTRYESLVCTVSRESFVRHKRPINNFVVLHDEDRMPLCSRRYFFR